MAYGIGIYDEGAWVVAAQGRKAESLINSIGTLKILKRLEDGRPVYAIDLRAVLERDGKIVCVVPTEPEASVIAGQKKGRRVVLARIVPGTAAGSEANEFALTPG